MEYIYKNSNDDSEKKIILRNTSLELYYDDAKYTIPYDKVIGVWLSKPGGFCSPSDYSCTLNIDERKPLYISSKNFDVNGNTIDQDNHYNSFIRVLHHHLSEKSRALYYSGVQPKSYWTRVMIIVSIIAACILSYNVLKVNMYLVLIPALIGSFITVCGLKFCISNFPHNYKPENIPLTLLPQKI